MERKELAVAQEKLAETISASRQLEQRYDQMKIELQNMINTKNGMEKLQEQSEMHLQILKQELDYSEQQKLTMSQHMQRIENHNSKIRDSLRGMIELIRSRSELYSDLYPDDEKMKGYEYLLMEIPKLDLQQNLLELPPCSIQTIQSSIYKPFMFSGAKSASAFDGLANTSVAHPQGSQALLGSQGPSQQKFNMFNQSQINLGQQPSSSQFMGNFNPLNQSIASMNPQAVEKALR